MFNDLCHTHGDIWPYPQTLNLPLLMSDESPLGKRDNSKNGVRM